MCMLVIMKPDTGESKINIVPAFRDGPGSISLAWGTRVGKLKPVTACVSRGIGSQLWHD